MRTNDQRTANALKRLGARPRALRGRACVCALSWFVLAACSEDSGGPSAIPDAGTSASPSVAGDASTVRLDDASVSAAPTDAATNPGVTSGASLDAGGSAAPMTEGGAAAGNTGASDAAGLPDTGSAASTCTRELLKNVTDMYFAALIAHDPTMLPLSDQVKYTENGVTVEIGQGAWKTASELKFKRSALDVTTCNAVTESVVHNGSDDFVVGLRLKLDHGQITEAESILVGPDGWFPNPTALANTASDDWETPLAADQQPTRDALKKVVDDYFELFSGGSVDAFPFASDCSRLENGFSPGACNFGIASFGSSKMTPRLYVLDVEASIAVGFVMFAGAYTDFHMFKVRDGEVHGVHAVLAAADGPGWD